MSPSDREASVEQIIAELEDAHWFVTGGSDRTPELAAEWAAMLIAGVLEKLGHPAPRMTGRRPRPRDVTRQSEFLRQQARRELVADLVEEAFAPRDR